jgi:hypothetical protein
MQFADTEERPGTVTLVDSAASVTPARRRILIVQFADRAVGGGDVEACGIEITTGPSLVVVVFLVRGVRGRFEEVGVSPRSTDILRRAGVLASRTKHRGFGVDNVAIPNGGDVVPVIAEVINVFERA